MSDTEAPETRPAKVPETEEQRIERLAKQEEADSRSVYVGNVDYKSTPEQLEEFFHTVGVIERVTILFDKYTGLPKGYAYIEFESTESVEKAISDLHGKTFRGREIRVTAKRTNLPGFKKRGGSRGRGSRGGFRGSSRGRGGRGSFRGRGRGAKKDTNADSNGETQEATEAPAAEAPAAETEA